MNSLDIALAVMNCESDGTIHVDDEALKTKTRKMLNKIKVEKLRTIAKTSKVRDYITTVYNPHTSNAPLRHDDDVYRAAFIDVGIRNFCVRYSEWNPNNQTLMGIGTCQVKYDFDSRKKSKDEVEIGHENEPISRMLQTLNADHSLRLSSCHYVVIEEQIKGFAADNLRIMYLLLGFIQTIVMDKGSKPIIVELNAKSKTDLLGYTPGCVQMDEHKNKYLGRGLPNEKRGNSKEHKIWSRLKAIQMLDLYSPPNSYDRNIVLPAMRRMTDTGKNKGDDHGDVVCYDIIWWNAILQNGVKSGKLRYPGRDITPASEIASL